MQVEWRQQYSTESIAQDAMDIFLETLMHTVISKSVTTDGEMWTAIVRYE